MITSDSELLQQFAHDRSEDAFAMLVRRHVDLVYSAALRQVRSTQLAEEISQTVFLDLSRHADKLTPETILTAWLYRVTRRTSIDVVRSESRRQLREQIAVELADMNSPDTHWMQIEPLLDEAMDTLDEADRSSILLRYFENKSLREVGQTLGTSDDAAQKRVSRAVER
ncbi:MAG: sigma-70 family RNA polymerase sigma factor, partial [Verrucomicrobiota bacterium]